MAPLPPTAAMAIDSASRPSDCLSATFASAAQPLGSISREKFHNPENSDSGAK